MVPTVTLMRNEHAAACFVADTSATDAEIGRRLVLLRGSCSFHDEMTSFLKKFEKNYVPPVKPRLPHLPQLVVFVCLYILVGCCVALVDALCEMWALTELTVPVSLLAAIVCAALPVTSANLQSLITLNTFAARSAALLLGITVAALSDIDIHPAMIRAKWLALVIITGAGWTNVSNMLLLLCIILARHPSFTLFLSAEIAFPVWFLLLLFIFAQFRHCPVNYNRTTAFIFAVEMLVLINIILAQYYPETVKEPAFSFIFRALPSLLLTVAFVPPKQLKFNAQANRQVLALLDRQIRYVRFYIKTADTSDMDIVEQITIRHHFDLPEMALLLHEKMAQVPLLCEICGGDESVDVVEKCDHSWVVCDTCLLERLAWRCPICDVNFK